MSHLYPGVVDLICDLPDNVSASICVSWLRLKCLGSLDISYCARDKRPAYLNILRSSGFRIKYKFKHNQIAALSWVCQRSIKVLGLEIAVQPSPVSENLLRITGNTLRFLTLQEIAEPGWNVLSECCKRVNHVKLCQCTLNAGLQCFIASNPFLKRVDFKNCLEAESVPTFTPRQNLQFLEITCNMHAIGELSILSMLQLGPPALKAVSINLPTSLTQPVLENIVRRFPNLKVICMGTKTVLDRPLEALLQSCKFLTHINMEENASVTDAALQAISTEHKVTLIDLSRNPQLTDAGLLGLVETQAGHVESVYLHGTSVTASGIEALVKNCPKLIRLSLPWNIDQAELITRVLPHCSNLTTLGFEWQTRLKNPFLMALAEFCPRIQDVALFVGPDACEGVSAIMRDCTELKNVVLQSGSPINAFAQAAWLHLRPGLTFFNRTCDILVKHYNFKASDPTKYVNL